MKILHTDTQPWYREPWPWLLMAGPAAVVVAGIATIWIAVVSSDGLVTEDYYKQGLAINQTLQREALAAERGYRGAVTVADAGRRVSVRMQSAPGAQLPDALQLRVVHPTRAGRDGLVLLRRNAAGTYDGVGPELSAGRWMLILQDTQASWRIDGAVVMPQQGAAMLAPAGSL